MASVMSIVLRRGVGHLKASPACVQTVRNYGDITQWKVGPTPKTEEEKKAAAAKYFMIPEDYDCWDEKEGFGDYPKFEGVGYDARDPYDDYDCEYERFFYGEPQHIDSVLWQNCGINPNLETEHTIWYYYLASLGTVTTIVLLSLTGFYFDITQNPTVKPKQFPGPGKKHYTFEPAYD